jgi:hypothetical protein
MWLSSAAHSITKAGIFKRGVQVLPGGFLPAVVGNGAQDIGQRNLAIDRTGRPLFAVLRSTTPDNK